MAERRVVRKRECSIVSFETTALGTTRYLEFDCADDPAFQIMHYIKAPLANGPEMVAAVGGIPDELKIKGGISYSVPCPTFTFPKYLPQDPILREWVLRRAFELTMVETDFRNAADQAYAKALRIYNQSGEERQEPHKVEQLSPSPTLLQVICKQLEEDEGLISLNQLPQAMIEVNLPPPPPLPPVHPVPTTKQAAWEENGSVKHEYSLVTIETPHGTPDQYLKRDCGDGTFDFITLRKIIVNEPGVVVAVGGIPDELKIKGAISFSFPHPILNFPTTPPKDQDEFKKVLRKGYLEALLKYDTKNAFIQAYGKALGLSSSSISEQSEKEKARNIDQEFCIMVEVNLAKRIRSTDQLHPNIRWIFWK